MTTEDPNNRRNDRNKDAKTVPSKRLSSVIDRRNQWWKVCWFYDKNVLLNRLGNQYAANTLPKLSQIRKQQEMHPVDDNNCQRSSTIGDFQLPPQLLGNHMSLLKETQNGTTTNGNTRSDGVTEPNKNMSANSLSMDGHRIPTKMFYTQQRHHASLDDMDLPLVSKESKSMTNMASLTTARQQGLFTLPRFLENNVQKEMTRFCNQQFYVSQLISTKIAQPLASWTKTKIDWNQNRIVNFLIDYKGSVWRERQLQTQMPNHDEQLFQQSTAESKFLRNKRRKALVRTELFVLTEQNESCQKCKREIPIQIHCIKIITPKFMNPTNNDSSCSNNNNNENNGHSTPRYFHIDCFVCSECSEILVDLKAYVNVWCDRQRSLINQKNLPFNLYCSRHFVEIFKPRCPFCDKLIFDEECTEAEGKAWHIGHFCCTECKRSLGGQQYIMARADNNKSQDNDQLGNDKQMPYCLTCFDIIFGDLCEECGLLIRCEVGAIVHEGRSWHANERCFRCSLCLKSLLGKPFLPALDGKIYCSIACSQAMIAHRKKSYKKQNKLQTINGDNHQNDRRIPTETQNLLDSKYATKSFVEQNRDNSIKTTIVHATNEYKAQETKLDYGSGKPKFNLSQMVDYVEFIKKNNQCFTTKYDWSKEQEFLSIVDPGHDVASQTNSTSDRTFEENSSQQSNARCEIDSQTSNQSTERWPFALVNPINNNGFNPNHRIYSTRNNNADLTSLSLASNDSQSSQQIHSTNQHFNFVEDKNNSLNSPTSSYEQTHTSPPPEYANIDNVEENSSNCSSFQNMRPVVVQRINGDYKVNMDPKMNRGSDQRSSNGSKDSTPTNGNLSGNILNDANHQHFPTANNPQTNPREKESMGVANNFSKSKSVSFDPNIKDNLKPEKKSIRRIRYRSLANGADDCSDSQSCSSCSTCSSSSDDDDDDFDFDQEFLRQKVENPTPNQNNNSNSNHNNNNESCIIS